MTKTKFAKIIYTIEWIIIAALFALTIGRLIDNNFLIEYYQYQWIPAQLAAYLFMIAVLPGSLIRLKIVPRLFAKLIFWQRAMGLLMFILATTHVLILIHLLPPGNALTASGAIAFIFLIPVALTSLDSAQKLLKRHWKTVQRLTYLAFPVLAIHFALTDHFLLSALYTLTILIIIASHVIPKLKNKRQEKIS